MVVLGLVLKKSDMPFPPGYFKSKDKDSIKNVRASVLISRIQAAKPAAIRFTVDDYAVGVFAKMLDNNNFKSIASVFGTPFVEALMRELEEDEDFETCMALSRHL